jgi:hypothetical protein
MKPRAGKNARYRVTEKKLVGRIPGEREKEMTSRSRVEVRRDLTTPGAQSSSPKLRRAIIFGRKQKRSDCVF